MKRALMICLLMLLPAAAADISLVQIRQESDYVGGAALVPGDAAGGASAVRLIDRPTLQGFRLVEEDNGAADAEVRYSLDIPAGSQMLDVRFSAHRSVRSLASGSEPAIEQTFAVRLEGAAEVAFVADLFMPNQRDGQVDVAYEIPISGGHDRLLLEWRFDERRLADIDGFPRPGVGDGLTADVIGLTWGFQQSFAAPPGTDRILATTGPDRVEAHKFKLDVLETGASRTHFWFEADPPLDQLLIHVQGESHSLISVDGGHRWQTVVEPAVEGRVDVTGHRTIPALPEPAATAVVAALFLLPVPAGVVATIAALRTSAWARIPGRHRHVLLTSMTFVCWLPYIGALAIGAAMPAALWGSPVLPAGIVAYALLTLALSGFLLLTAMHRRWQAHASEYLFRQERARNEHLSRMNDELTQFAYIASHDLREPLRTVVRFTELVEQGYGDRLDDKGREFLRFANDGAERMEGLLGDLLKYTQTGSALRLQEADLGQIIRSAHWGLRAACQDVGATIEVSDMPTIEGDPHLLRQVFQNLIANSIKFRSPERACTIRFTSSPLAGGFQITVSDNGIGIPAGALARVFEPFGRGHSRAEFPGSGIGLAVVHKIIGKHNGSIRVESSEGETTMFTIWLPQRQPEHPPLLPSKTLFRARGGSPA